VTSRNARYNGHGRRHRLAGLETPAESYARLHGLTLYARRLQLPARGADDTGTDSPHRRRGPGAGTPGRW
jgi:hypothetical protein